MGPLALAITASLASVLPSAPPSAVRPLMPDIILAHDDAWERMTVAVHIGQNGPFRFLVDTGSEHTVLADSLVARLGLVAGDRRQITGVAGTLYVSTVSLSDIRVGHRAFDDRVVPLLPAASISADGILGVDGLQGQRVLLDFRRNRLVVTDVQDHDQDQESDAGYEIVVRASRRGRQLIITHARLDDTDIDVVIDTGAQVSIGNRALQRALARRRPSTPAKLMSVTGQEINADFATGGTLKIDALSIANMQIAYADAPAFAALHLDKRPTVLLGMRELRAMNRVAIDFAHRKVLFDVTS